MDPKWNLRVRLYPDRKIERAPGKAASQSKKVEGCREGKREVGERSEKQVCTLCLAVDGTVMHGEENKRFTRLGRNF